MQLHEAFQEFPIIITERLMIRKITKSDEEAYNALSLDHDVNNYWGYSTPNKAFRQEQQQEKTWYDTVMSSYYDKSTLPWIVADKNTDKMLGEIFLYEFKGEFQAEVGYRFLREAWGHGYATEALKAVVRFGKEKLQLHRIELRCIVGNDASVKVAEKSGFVKEGLIRQGHIINIFADYYIYGHVTMDKSKD